MDRYVYWHAPVWQILLMVLVSLAVLAWLTMRALRRPDVDTALFAVDPTINVHPLFFFDRVKGITCLNDAARRILQQLSASEDKSRVDVLTETLLEAYEEARITRQEGWPEADRTLVASPICTPVGDVRGVLALVAIERPPLPADNSTVVDALSTEDRDWLAIGHALRIHRMRPVVRVRRSNEATPGDDMPVWQEYQLSHLEETLLRYLLEHPSEVQSTTTLFKIVWPDDDVRGHGLRPEQQDRLRRLIYQLRQHTEPDPRNPRFIVTAHGAGYALYPEQELVV